MASNKLYTLGPVLVTTTTTTNIMNPGTTTGGTASTAAPYDKLLITLRHIRVTNNSSAAVRIACWKGATGTNTVGKEFAFAGTATTGAIDASVGVSIAAGSYADWYGAVPFTTSDFLVGGCSAANALTLTAEGEIGVA